MSAPVAGFMVTPGGRLPLAMAQVTEPLAPETVGLMAGIGWLMCATT